MSNNKIPFLILHARPKSWEIGKLTSLEQGGVTFLFGKSGETLGFIKQIENRITWGTLLSSAENNKWFLSLVVPSNRENSKYLFRLFKRFVTNLDKNLNELDQCKLLGPWCIKEFKRLVREKRLVKLLDGFDLDGLDHCPIVMMGDDPTEIASEDYLDDFSDPSIEDGEKVLEVVASPLEEKPFSLNDENPYAEIVVEVEEDV